MLFAALLVSVLVSPAGAASPADAPPEQTMSAFSVLPPGESGHYSSDAQAQYEADGNAEDFGPHVDDQREMYWSSDRKSADFQQPTGTAVEPTDGVRIYRDSFGVPLVYGDNGYDVWFGAGYAAATDRLFEIDAVRRTARGTLAELAGASDVPADLQVRTLTYTDAEYDAMLAGLSPQGQDAIKGYAAGVQARIEETKSDPSLLPAEYQVLTTTPADWTVNDTLAAGVYITRFVASQGGEEMANVASLQELRRSTASPRADEPSTRSSPTTTPMRSRASRSVSPTSSRAIAQRRHGRRRSAAPPPTPRASPSSSPPARAPVTHRRRRSTWGCTVGRSPMP
jgi:hypothetical protein